MVDLKDKFRVLKKALHVLTTQGFRAFISLYHQRKERLRQERNLEENDIVIVGNNLYNNDGVAPDVPQEWIDLQRKQPLISIVLDCTFGKEYVEETVTSLQNQKYKNFELLVVGCPNIDVNTGRLSYFDTVDDALKNAVGELVGLLEAGEVLEKDAFAYVLDGYNESDVSEVFVLPDDRIDQEGMRFSPDYKNGIDNGIGGAESILHFGLFRNHGYSYLDGTLSAWIDSLQNEQRYHVPWICVHKHMIASDKKDDAVRCVAFYLPQFHEIPENNEWWGKGFTEWVNVKRAKPLYEGHNQPRTPGELGYYDLAGEEGDKIQRRQIELAKEYDLSGFCYYYYWFDGGKRLLEMPLDRHLNDPTYDFPFCLCWANENWTRQWDGQKSDVLMPQTYKSGWAEQFILDMLPYLKDPRYIRVNGAPFIMIYNVAEIKDAEKAIKTWREVAKANGIERLHISAVRRTLDSVELEKTNHTLDSLSDFPPHLLGYAGVDAEDAIFDRFERRVKDYRKAVKYHTELKGQPYSYFRAAMLEWDNTARKGENAYLFAHFSYEQYCKWLFACKRYTMRHNKKGEDLLIVNAWNEWAEGTYLEPNGKDGRKALEVTREALRMR